MDHPDLELERLRSLLPFTMAEARLRCAPRLDDAARRLELGQPVDRSLRECATLIENGITAAERRGALPLQISYPEQLPVSMRRAEILESLRRHPLLVLTGETGSGKTTQLPKMLLELGCGRHGMIALTQPRRVAAVAMAARIREELAASEATVAHAVRFDDRSGPDTLLKVLTDGLLLAEITSDQLFSRYDAVIVDEAHERSLDIDLLLGFLTRARQRRPELRVVVSSASIAADRFAAYLGADVPVVSVSGRTFPVEIIHAPPSDDDVGYLDAAVRWIRDLHESQDASGDVLVFLPTERDILDADRRLREVPGLTPMPLFGRLTPHEQQRIFQPTRGRKVVLATNIAETSLTIPGIRFVVDTGLARMKRYQPSTRTERLPIEPVSRASALQRAGRAGRVEAGVCIRLYGEDDLSRRDEFTAPEVLRSNLAGVLLRCLAMGIADATAFPWLDAPALHAWQQAEQLLEELGALADGRLTSLGRNLAAIPADPQVGRILIAGLTEGVAHEACTIAAFLSVQDPRVRPLGQEAKADSAHRALAHEAGDLATVLRLWERWQAAESNSRKERLCEDLYLGRRRMREWADVRHQLWSSLRERNKGQVPDAHAAEQWPLDRVHRCVLSGMLGNVLMWDPEQGVYRAAGDRQLWVHPGSALRSGKDNDGKRAPPPAPWLVACEVVETSRLFARLCAPIDPLWVVELVGDRLKRSYRDPHWHAQRKQVLCLETATWKGLPVREGRLIPFERVDAAEAGRIFIRSALVDEDGLKETILLANRRLFAEARSLRERLRDPALAVEPEHLEAWYQERIGPTPISSGDTFGAFLKAHPEALRLTLADLVPAETSERAAAAPSRVRLATGDARLSYRFSPSSADDGVTLHLDERQAAGLTLAVLDSLVPAWLPETVAAYLEQLPKDDRRRLIPLAETARAITDFVRPHLGQAGLTDLIAQALWERHRLRCTCDRRLLPDWLRPRVVVHGEAGVVWSGRDPDFLAQQAEAAADRLAPLKAEWETAPSAGWPGDCPGPVEIHGVRGFVGLARDRRADGTLAVRRTVYPSADAAEAWHGDGLEAALEAALEPELAAWIAAPASINARCERNLGCSLGAARRQLALAAAWASPRGRIRDGETFAIWLDAARQAVALARRDGDALLGRTIERAERLRLRLKQGARNLAAASAARHIGGDLARLCAQPWAQHLPHATLRRFDLLLDALERRLAASGSEAVRLEERISNLHAECDAALDPADARLMQALGLGAEIRQLNGLREETALAYATPGSVGAAARSESALRLRLIAAERQVDEARTRIADTRLRLGEAATLFARMAPGTRRSRLEEEQRKLLAGFPDLSLGADLGLQHQAAAALIARIRAAL